MPFLGVGVFVAGTAYEIYEACEGMKDWDELYAGLGMGDEVPGDVVKEVCEVDLGVFRILCPIRGLPGSGVVLIADVLFPRNKSNQEV
jgi:hypothetical protein